MNVIDREYLLSKVWGSFFYQPDEDPQHNRHMNTFWGEMITKYTDIAIPSIEYLASKYSLLILFHLSHNANLTHYHTMQ